MTNDFTAIGAAGAASPACAVDERETRSEACAVSVNAERVLDTTRRAWSETAVNPTEAHSERRPARASQTRRRIVPRSSRWPSLIAALNYWSPKPL
jgi:cell division septation protein DedD